ncbi:9357_t:CDS:2, partial [Acaulospora colombiana]
NPTNSSIFYVTDETEDGALNSLVLEHATGKVTPVASIPTQGGSPTHIGLVNNGSQLGVANYGGGSTFFATLEDDQLHFSNPQLLKFDQVPASNAHQVVASGNQVMVADLAADRVWRLTQDGSNNWSIETLTDGSLYTLHEKANTLSQQVLTPTLGDAQPDAVSSISIIPSDTPSSATLYAGELLMAHEPSTLIYASNREDPSPEGDAIAIFQTNPLTKVASIRTGLKHLRGVALVGENDAYLIAGGMNGGGIKIYERVSPDQGYLKEIASLAANVVEQPSSFIWAAQQESTVISGTTPITAPSATTPTTIQPTVSRSAGCRRFKIEANILERSLEILNAYIIKRGAAQRFSLITPVSPPALFLLSLFHSSVQALATKSLALSEKPMPQSSASNDEEHVIQQPGSSRGALNAPVYPPNGLYYVSDNHQWTNADKAQEKCKGRRHLTAGQSLPTTVSVYDHLD